MYLTDPATAKPVLDDKGKAILIGDAAHIETSDSGSPRYNPSLSEEDSNKVENLVALCKNCHKMVDSNTGVYTPDKLREIKRRHEEWARKTLRKSILQLGYEDLRRIGEIVGAQSSSHKPPVYDTIPHEEKILKNDISAEIQGHLTDGFSQVWVVRQYMNDEPFLGMASKLQETFVSLYLELREKGLRGDALFNELWDLSSGYSIEGMIRAGSLVMISYFFELCEVFEK